MVATVFSKYSNLLRHFISQIKSVAEHSEGFISPFNAHTTTSGKITCAQIITIHATSLKNRGAHKWFPMIRDMMFHQVITLQLEPL